MRFTRVCKGAYGGLVLFDRRTLVLRGVKQILVYAPAFFFFSNTSPHRRLLIAGVVNNNRCFICWAFHLALF
jgi:hypothetical protein